MAIWSQRTSWDRTPTALADRVERRRARGDSILDLTLSNPTLCGLDRPDSSVPSLLDNPHARTYHPDPRGLLETRQAIAECYRVHRISVSPESIVLTSGTSEAYCFLLSLLCDAGDTVLVPRPGYPIYEFLAQSQDVRLMPYELRYDGEWSIDWGFQEHPLPASASAMIVLHPNYPTGSYIKSEEKEPLARFRRAHSIPLISDEVFWFYPHTPVSPPASFAEDAENLTFVLGGLSKMLGLPQLKISWVIVAGSEEAKHEALLRLEMLGDLMLSVSTPVQGAATRLLERSEEFAGPIRVRVAENLKTLHHLAQGSSGVETLRCEGGWSAVLRVPTIQSDEQWAISLLERRGVLVHPGSQLSFTKEGFLVISLLPEPETFRRGIDELVLEVSRQLQAYK